uniref:Uncharacterized protein n=1 Tax=Anguilla anguilla TaxID=7936 RepID=A0A0E9S6F2_ANGAN
MIAFFGFLQALVCLKWH